MDIRRCIAGLDASKGIDATEVNAEISRAREYGVALGGAFDEEGAERHILSPQGERVIARQLRAP